MQEQFNIRQRPSTGRSEGVQLHHPLMEPTLFYDPPYERPLEDEFAWHLVKYLTPVCSLAYQHRVKTPGGTFWIDFVVEFRSRRFGFEIGDLSEVGDEEQERLRDALIVGTGAVDVLYRFRGADVLHRLHDCLTLIARWEPELFSTRGHVNLNTLATSEAYSSKPKPSDTEYRITYSRPSFEDEYEGESFEWPERDAEPELVVRRFARGYPAGWIRTYDRALAHFGVDANDLNASWAKSA